MPFRFRYNVIRDALIVVLVDTLVSFLSGFLVFGLLGSLAFQLHVSVKEAVSSGESLDYPFLYMDNHRDRIAHALL